MSALPETIKVGPYLFRVLADARAIKDAKTEAESSGCIGQTHYHRLEIVVDPDLAPDMLAKTLLHEALHACFLVGGRDNPKLVQEDFISRVSPTLLGVLRDNPALVAYLTEAPHLEPNGHAARSALEKTSITIMAGRS